MNITNTQNIDLAVAIWLAQDDYDGTKDKNVISATSLLKPLKSIVLERTLPVAQEIDLSSLIASRLGTAVHTAIEKAWDNKIKVNNVLSQLGYSEKAIEKIITSVTQEVRAYKDMVGFTITGKYDFNMNGQVQDFKTTKTYSWISGSNVPNYIKQLSIYKWLNPELITEDTGKIHYIFTDWSPLKALADKSYPQQQIISKTYPLMSLEETENFIVDILNKVTHYSKLNQEEMPECTKEELWQDDTTYAYYKDKNKLSRSTKNFDNPVEANARLASDGNKGIVVTRPGIVKRCAYCNAASVCKQREQLQAQGLIK